MKSFWFAVRISVLFTVVTAVVLACVLLLFGQVAGHSLLRQLGLLRCHEGLVIAEQIEKMLEGRTLDDAEIHELVTAAPRPWGLKMHLHHGTKLPSARPHGVLKHAHEAPSLEEVELRGRRCFVVGPPATESWVPIIADGETVATLVLRGPMHSRESHFEFLVGLLSIGALALIGVVLLSVYLTVPLRRMSLSMDRIAAGNLDHRVPVRGRDEVATMGRSFNTMADRIGAMIRGQKELLAGVSHELRSPLARMKMATELLRESGAEEDRLRDVEDEVDAIDGMVEELLTASRLDLGSAQLRLEEVDIEELAQRAWRRVDGQAREAGMELVLEIEPASRRIKVDTAVVVRALGNVFENAVLYSGSGKVKLSATREDEVVRVSVADSGPGVDPDQLDRLFEPFFRADPSRSRRTGSTGLGLMIVRRAVEAHGGSVSASINSPGGLVLTLSFPDQ